MKILLIDPPYERLMGIKTTSVYPIGLSYLAATSNQAGHEAIYMNFDYEEDLPIVNPFSRIANINNYQTYLREVSNNSNRVWELFRKLILEISPQVVGISCVTVKMKSALMMAKIIKEVNPDIKVILGGHHAMLYAEEILRYCTNIDIIALGEFDYGLVEVVNALEKNSGTLYEKLCNIPGLCLRNQQDTIISTGVRELISSLDTLPFPESACYYQNSDIRVLPLTSMIASRGCPYQCTYCATTNLWGRGVRWRSPENFFNEIKYRIRTYNMRNFNFFDDCFTLNKEWVVELCDRIIKDKVSINWSCISSINLIDESLFKKIVEAGCIKINLGVESGSERIARLAKRTVKMEKIRQVFNYAKKYNISTAAYFMIGFPTETVQDIRETQRFIGELSPNWAYVNVLIPLPGTEMFRMCVDTGLIDKKMAWCGDLYRGLQTNYTGVINDSKFNELVDETFTLGFRNNKRISNLFRRVPIRQYTAKPAKIYSDTKKLISWMRAR